MAKITLYVKDEATIERAKTFAEKNHTSVSELVEQFLGSLSSERLELEGERAPILRQLQAALRGAKGRHVDYQSYVEKKYG